jgi:acetylornithine deacetylase
MLLEINEQRLTKLLGEMVKIESINPDLVPGGSGEKEVAEFTANYMSDAGLEAYIQEIIPGRCNAVGILRGTGGGKTLLIDAHLDTVSVEGMKEPFSGRVDNGKLFGRGSGDNKGGVAAAVEALIALKEAKVNLSGNVIVAGVAGEEYASEGTEAFISKYRDVADGCIIGEPSRMSQGLYLGLGVGSGGFVWVEFETKGERAHGSLYKYGIDAIDHMGAVLSEIAKLKQNLLSREPYVNPMANHGATLNPSIHNSLIQGGLDLATYPDLCRLSVERRMVYGETFELVRHEMEDVIKNTSSQVPGIELEMRILFEREPWEAQNGLLFEIAHDELERELGQTPSRYGIAGWNDGAISSSAGIETIVFGPSGDDWHGSNEFVDLKSLHKCAYVMARTAQRFCV